LDTVIRQILSIKEVLVLEDINYHQYGIDIDNFFHFFIIYTDKLNILKKVLIKLKEFN